MVLGGVSSNLILEEGRGRGDLGVWMPSSSPPPPHPRFDWKLSQSRERRRRRGGGGGGRTSSKNIGYSKGGLGYQEEKKKLLFLIKVMKKIEEGEERKTFVQKRPISPPSPSLPPFPSSAV